MYIVIHKSTRSVPDTLVQKSFLVLNKSCGLRGWWFAPAKNRQFVRVELDWDFFLTFPLFVRSSVGCGRNPVTAGLSRDYRS